MPSGEIRLVKENCRATIGSVGNQQSSEATIGKAGRNRWKGRRPRVRGVAMNPVDHPMGGGEGRTSGGGLSQFPWVSYRKVSQLAKNLNHLILKYLSAETVDGLSNRQTMTRSIKKDFS